MLRHSTGNFLQTFSVSLVVVLHQTDAELFDCLLAGPVLRTFMQNSVTFLSRVEAASDVISNIFVTHIFLDIAAKLCDPGFSHFSIERLSLSRQNRPRVVGDGLSDRKQLLLSYPA